MALVHELHLAGNSSLLILLDFSAIFGPMDDTSLLEQFGKLVKSAWAGAPMVSIINISSHLEWDHQGDSLHAMGIDLWCSTRLHAITDAV